MSNTPINPILTSRDTINPYRTALGLIKSKFLWDIQPRARNSKKKLIGLKDKFYGQKAVIMCNGPSLNRVDFDLLSDSGVYTFGLNKINLLFDRVDFRPSSIVCINKLVIEQNHEFFNNTDIPLFLEQENSKQIKDRLNVCFLHSAPLKSFARDCTQSINQGGTVTFVAMQLAFHFGFHKVGLVGCDHYFQDKGAASATVVSSHEDNNHFDKRYFSGGQAWQLPDIPQSEYSYIMAREQFSAFGRTVYNCTEGGFLEVYERQSLSDFLAI